MNKALRGGVAQVNITPPVGCILCGPPRRSKTVHDELCAKALVLEDGTGGLALVTCDLIGLGFDIVERTRALIEEQTGLPASHVMLNCSHTHCGPYTTFIRGYGKPDAAYIETLVRKIAGVVFMAWNSRMEAKIGVSRESVQIGVNRREFTPDRGMILGQNWEGPVNPNVDVLRVDGEDGRPIAVFFSHAAHPVVLINSLSITADYPGYAAAVLEKVYCCEMVAMFAQGCCGNINAQVVSGTFEDARRLGTILGAAALKAAETVEPSCEAKINAGAKVIQLPLRVPTVEEAEATLREQTVTLEQAQKQGGASELRRAQVMVDWAQDYLAAAKAGEPQTLPYEIQVFTIGQTAVVGLAGEVFVEIGLNIEARSVAHHTIALGYANKDIGFAGYVPTAAAFDEGGPEPNAYRYSRALPLDPMAAELIEQTAVELIGWTLALVKQ